MALDISINVESALCPSPSLKQLLAEMQNDADEARTKLGDLLIPGVPLYPVPFLAT
jgi:hypothetical protein